MSKTIEEILGTYTVWAGRDVNTESFKRTVKAIEAHYQERIREAIERAKPNHDTGLSHNHALGGCESCERNAEDKLCDNLKKELGIA
jgi:hypothetical protein